MHYSNSARTDVDIPRGVHTPRGSLVMRWAGRAVVGGTADVTSVLTPTFSADEPPVPTFPPPLRSPRVTMPHDLVVTLTIPYR